VVFGLSLSSVSGAFLFSSMSLDKVLNSRINPDTVRLYYARPLYHKTASCLLGFI
jgi:hypothetical protein